MSAAHRHDLPGGFFKSTDGGVTWRESAQLKNEAIHSLAQSESDPDTLIAGTFTRIFRSDDAGDTWKQLPTTARHRTSSRRVAGDRSAHRRTRSTPALSICLTNQSTAANLEVDQERNDRRLRHLRDRYRSARSKSHHCFRVQRYLRKQERR